MPDQTVACAEWRALDREGSDRCRLSRVAHGWLLVGHARFHDAQGFAALDYVLRCDENWHTLSADIAGMHEGHEVQIRILREDRRWWLNGTPQRDAAGAMDLDISFTPATNLMPLRRLAATAAQELEVSAAWLRYPHLSLARLDQVYRRTAEPDTIAYEARQSGFATRLTVDPSGFVLLYPGAWEGEVGDEG